MLSGVKTGLGVAAGAIVAGLLVFAWAILFAVPGARQDERKLAEADQTNAIFDQIKERGLTDAAVKNMPDAELCRTIGGVLLDGDCR